MATAAALNLLLYLFWISLLFISGSLQLCIEKERKALLDVRSGFPAVDSRLSPWKGDDCCSWERVGCDNITGHVVELDLFVDIYPLQYGTVFNRSEMHPSLFHLKHLKYLDISRNNLSSHQIPSSIGSLTQLQHLDLSQCDFKGEIPYQLGNLFNLRYLSLSFNGISGQIPASFAQLRNLQFLYLSGNSIHGDVLKSIGNLSKMSCLDLSDNRIVGGLPETIGNLTALQNLDLSYNDIDGKIPDSIGNLLQLESLRISGNNISGSILDTLGSLCNLSKIDLSFNSITGRVAEFFEQLSRSRPNEFHSLDMRSNQLSGSVPASLGKLSALRVLILSSNYLVGDITEAHFANLTNLVYMDISDNNLSVNVSQNWLPPFQASCIFMRSCNLGPRFPPWLWNQTSLDILDISNNGIADAFPDWFWSLCLFYMELNVSHNNMRGMLPRSLECFKDVSILDLSYNNFEGFIPRMQPWEAHLDLSHNFFSGPIPSCLVGNAMYLSLSNNRLNGSIPTTLGLSKLLRSLHLNNNNLSGTIPTTLKQCIKLVVIDFSWNELSGDILSWIGPELSSLRVLSLRSNKFTGGIPSELSLIIPSLQVLDLAHNLFFGLLPTSFGNFTAMMTNQNLSSPLEVGSLYYTENLTIIAKDLPLDFTTLLKFVTNIDLSNNNLSGMIPEEITNLHGLRYLNLSFNYFSGQIPEKIGLMDQLESLDLSKNNLSGRIPSSISALTFLTVLNLSYNNLVGKIPVGPQLQTFTNLSYMENPELCGEPLETKCIGVPEEEQVHEDDEYGGIWYFIGFAPGFVIGFWGFMGAIMIKKSIRIKYILLIDSIISWFIMHM